MNIEFVSRETMLKNKVQLWLVENISAEIKIIEEKFQKVKDSVLWEQMNVIL